MFEQSIYSGRKEHTNSGSTRMSFRDATNPTLQRTAAGGCNEDGTILQDRTELGINVQGGFILVPKTSAIVM
jgi:hypothetical protein